MSGYRCYAAIPRQQRRVQDLCQRNIHSVVRSEIAAQFPHPRQKEIMWVSVELKISKISNRSAPTQIRDIADCRVATENLGDFDIDQVRGMQRVLRIEKPSLDQRRSLRLQKHFEDCGSIDDDHSQSRSVRMA